MIPLSPCPCLFLCVCVCVCVYVYVSLSLKGNHVKHNITNQVSRCVQCQTLQCWFFLSLSVYLSAYLPCLSVARSLSELSCFSVFLYISWSVLVRFRPSFSVFLHNSL